MFADPVVLAQNLFSLLNEQENHEKIVVHLSLSEHKTYALKTSRAHDSTTWTAHARMSLMHFKESLLAAAQDLAAHLPFDADYAAIAVERHNNGAIHAGITWNPNTDAPTGPWNADAFQTQIADIKAHQGTTSYFVRNPAFRNNALNLQARDSHSAIQMAAFINGILFHGLESPMTTHVFQEYIFANPLDMAHLQAAQRDEAPSAIFPLLQEAWKAARRATQRWDISPKSEPSLLIAFNDRSHKFNATPKVEGDSHVSMTGLSRDPGFSKADAIEAQSLLELAAFEIKNLPGFHESSFALDIYINAIHGGEILTNLNPTQDDTYTKWKSVQRFEEGSPSFFQRQWEWRLAYLESLPPPTQCWYVWISSQKKPYKSTTFTNCQIIAADSAQHALDAAILLSNLPLDSYIQARVCAVPT